jgi:uncharacterized protein YutE (UPF0331/DUF86 family)
MTDWVSQRRIRSYSRSSRRQVGLHGYAAVDARLVREVLESHLEDLLTFAAEIRKKLEPTDEP